MKRGKLSFSLLVILSTLVWSNQLVGQSRIEKIFTKDKIIGLGEDLKQFGYDIFAGAEGRFAPADTSSVGREYILGPNDELIIDIWGKVNERYEMKIDREGKITIPKIGAIYVWGKNFEDASEQITKSINGVYANVSLNISLGRLRTIRVFILGNVKKPGGYLVSGVSTILHGLYQAGGPANIGSLRNIQLLRQDKIVKVFDLYDLLLKGNRVADTSLLADDIIYVPVIGCVVGIFGNVKQPAIYEVKPEEKLFDVIEMAQAIMDVGFIQKVQIERLGKGGKHVVATIELNNKEKLKVWTEEEKLKSGDVIRLFPTLYDDFSQSTVSIKGQAHKPGSYRYKEGMKISDLIFAAGGVTDVAYLERAELFRKNIKKGGPGEIIEIGLTNVVLDKKDNPQNLTIEKEDQLFIYSNPELVKRAVVTIKGEVKFPSAYIIHGGERLSSVINRAGGFKETAFIKGITFIRNKIKDVQKEAIDKFIDSQRQAILQEEALLVDSVISNDKKELQLSSLESRKKALDLIAAKRPDGRIIVDLENDILLQDGDRIIVPEVPDWVAVVGAVYNPGSIAFKTGQKFTYYLDKVGGVIKYADKESIYVIMPDGVTQSSNTGFGVVEKGSIVVVPTKLKIK